MDKDLGTRPLFRNLVSQGYPVMDIAYRLCPEVDIVGMAGDVKRAIAWMKANAARYGWIQKRSSQGELRPADIWPSWQPTRPSRLS
jgi:acetyl esterase/lipase